MTEQDRQRINDCIVKISKGDSLALEELSRLVSGRMLSVAVSVVGSKSIAEEVVQDAFVRIYQNAARFRSGSNGYAWICKITQNVALNRLRSERNGMSVNIDEVFYLAADDNVEEQSVAAVMVRDAMKCCTVFERRVIYQKYFMDITVRDSAKILGRSRSAVARAIASGERKIKNYLNGGTNLPHDVL